MWFGTGAGAHCNKKVVAADKYHQSSHKLQTRSTSLIISLSRHVSIIIQFVNSHGRKMRNTTVILITFAIIATTFASKSDEVTEITSVQDDQTHGKTIQSRALIFGNFLIIFFLFLSIAEL